MKEFFTQFFNWYKNSFPWKQPEPSNRDVFLNGLVSGTIVLALVIILINVLP